jgi:hypothetical protein
VALKVSRGTDERLKKFSSKALVVVTILPLWALWVYAYASLRSLQTEMETLPRFYGMHLYKEYVRARLEEAARVVSVLGEQRVQRTEEGTAKWFGEEGRKNLAFLLGPEEAFVVVERGGLRILHPSGPPYGSAEFLVEPAARHAFLRTVQRMDASGSQGGYFSIENPDPEVHPSTHGWFLAMASAGEDLLCILPVPEEKMRQAGGVLQEAQKTLLEERRKKFLLVTLPVLLLSSVFIVILCRQQSDWDGERKT